MALWLPGSLLTSRLRNTSLVSAMHVCACMAAMHHVHIGSAQDHAAPQAGHVPKGVSEPQPTRQQQHGQLVQLASPPQALQAQQRAPASVEQEQERQRELQQSHQASKQPRLAGQPTHKQPAKPRPTHFVALRVSHSPQVVACIERVQAQLLSTHPQLQPCLLEPVTAHKTLLVLHLQDEVHQAALGAVLASLAGALRAQGLGQQAVALAGLSAFRNQVLYLDVSPGRARDQLQRLGDAIVSHFQAAGGDLVLPEPGRGFTPHVTVAKTSRLQGRRHHHPGKGRGGRGSTKIPPEAWAALASADAGSVLLQELTVCSMQGRKAGEYYRVTHSLQLPEVPPMPPPAPAPAPAAPAPAPAPAQPHGRLAAAKRRVKRLLQALTCGAVAAGAMVDSEQDQQQQKPAKHRRLAP